MELSSLKITQMISDSHWLTQVGLIKGHKTVVVLYIYVVGCWRGHLSGARCILAKVAYGSADATATRCLLLH